MSPAEIEKLKELAAFKTPLNVHVARMEAHAALPRLLEERERLLEALRAALSVGEIRFRTCVLAADVGDKIHEAISFAEEKAT